MVSATTSSTVSSGRIEAYGLLKLSRDLHLEMASRLDLATRKTLSLCCKTLRHNMLAIIFDQATAPERGNRLSPVMMPMHAMEWVRTYSIFVVVVDEAYPTHEGARAAMIQQLGLLPFLPNLQHVKLYLHIHQHLDPSRLAPPLPTLAASLRTLACQSSTLDICINTFGPKHAAERQALSILPSLLDPLLGAQLSRLSIRGLFMDPLVPADFAEDPAYQAFCRLAPTLRHFIMQDLCWLALCPNPVSMPMLETLELGYWGGPKHAGLTMAHMAEVLKALPLVVNAASQRLKTLTIGFEYSLLNQQMQDTINALPSLACPVLNQLDLQHNAFTVLMPIIGKVACTDLSVCLKNHGDWTRLCSLLSDAASCLTKLRRLEIDYHVGDAEPYPIDAPPYAAIRAAAQARNLDMTIIMRGPDLPSPIDDLLRCLGEMQDELEELEYGLPYERFDPFSAYNSDLHVVLTKCKRMEWRVSEDMESEFPETQSLAFGAAMMHISAPVLEDLHLHIYTPFSTPIPALVDALERDAYPELRRIVENFSIDLWPTKGGWEDSIRQPRKESLLSVCQARGIDVTGLRWT